MELAVEAVRADLAVDRVAGFAQAPEILVGVAELLDGLDPTVEGDPLQRPFSGPPSRAAKQAPESNRGRQSQSIDPSRLTSAAVRQSPIIA
jgi:hypothetical protein